MVAVYVIIEIATGNIAHEKAYFNARDAKLALKYHKCSRASLYAVARIIGEPTPIATVGPGGKWAEVSAE